MKLEITPDLHLLAEGVDQGTVADAIHNHTRAAEAPFTPAEVQAALAERLAALEAATAQVIAERDAERARLSAAQAAAADAAAQAQAKLKELGAALADLAAAGVNVAIAGKIFHELVQVAANVSVPVEVRELARLEEEKARLAEQIAAKKQALAPLNPSLN